jgi:hypothetical protein
MKKLEPSDRSNTHQLQNCKLCLTRTCFSALSLPQVAHRSGQTPLMDSCLQHSLPRFQKTCFHGLNYPLIGHTSERWLEEFDKSNRSLLNAIKRNHEKGSWSLDCTTVETGTNGGTCNLEAKHGPLTWYSLTSACLFHDRPLRARFPVRHFSHPPRQLNTSCFCF